MTRHVLAAVGLLVLPACTANFPAARPAPTAATPPAQNVIPPVEFDHPYPGKLVVERSSSQEYIRSKCGPTTFPYHLGCAFLRIDGRLILMADDATITRAGWTTSIVLRHEEAHWSPAPRLSGAGLTAAFKGKAPPKRGKTPRGLRTPLPSIFPVFYISQF